MSELTDVDIATVTLWGEARGEPIEGRIAVACVLRNRVADGRWGDTYTDVCLAPKQFSCWNEGRDANHAAVMVLVEDLKAGRFVNDPILKECYWIMQGVMNSIVRDRVPHATHYYAASMREPPAWADDADLVARVGNHLFYARVA